MKAIIMAGGHGTRLFPSTRCMSKHLFPVFDKPMIYYPLSVVMLAGIRNVLLIVKPEDYGSFYSLLGDGSQFGINLEYKEQEDPRGISDAFIIGRSFIGNDNVMLILGDNIFYGNGLSDLLKKSILELAGSTVFCSPVNNPEQFGIVEFGADGNPVCITEKPCNPVSNQAVTGLYLYDNSVLDLLCDLAPSQRGELEITDINQSFLKNSMLKVVRLSRGYTWFDAGTSESLLAAATFVEAVQNRQGFLVCAPEEIAFKNSWITRNYFLSYIDNMPNCLYKNYLKKIDY